MVRTLLPLVALCLVGACTGGGAPVADADGLAKPAEVNALSDEAARREERVRAAKEDLERRRAERSEKTRDMAADDGWRAPASVADPAACRSADPPQPHDPREIKPLPLPSGAHPALKDVSLANERAPDLYKARFETSAGDFVIEVNREWAPIGADRFYNLVKVGYFDNASFFRNIPGFMVQFGINPYPEVNEVWKDARIEDEPVRMGNQRGVVTFAKCGAPNCRSTQVFINHTANVNLDGMGFAGFGRVVDGMDVVDRLYGCYGEGAPRGRGPRQDLVQGLGRAYLDAGWPKLDLVKRASIVE
jgi:peptidyl-prolyl cis-trans isomerase A (cyclophilin A)